MSGNDSEFQKLITGSINSNGGLLDLTSPNNGTTAVQLTGTWIGTLLVEVSIDNVNWQSITVLNLATSAPSATMTANGIYLCPTNSLPNIRMRASAWTSGLVSINSWGSNSPGTNLVRIDPIGTTTQPVSITNTPVPVSGTLTTNTTIGTINDTEKGREYTSYSPDPTSHPDIISEVSLDYSDQTMIRGQVLTDEGSFRDDFTGSALTRALTGNIQWGSNDTEIVGTGSCLFTTQCKSGDYIKKGSDAESAWTQIDYIFDDNLMYLKTGYLGSNGTSTGVVSNWKPVTATGGAITVANSVISITSGTTSGQTGGIVRTGDYLPYNLSGKFNISQRIANQTITWGFQDNLATPAIQACFIFDGTTNTTVKCRSSISTAAADTEETTITLPTGNTASDHTYGIDLTSTQAAFIVDGTVVAVHNNHIPGPYDNLSIHFVVKNTAVVTTTTIAMNFGFFSNVDQLEITSGFKGEALKATPAEPSQTYSATIIGLVAANTATDFFTITGSATKVIKVKKIMATATQTTGATNNIVLLKRSAANTGGTSTTPTAVPLDSNNAAATAVINAYTANPSSLGAIVGNFRATKLFIPATTAIPGVIDWNFGDNNGQEPRLRGTTQVLAINLNSVTVAGNSFNITIEWTEE